MGKYSDRIEKNNDLLYILIFLVIFMIVTNFSRAQQNNTITPVVQSLISNDHTSEGFMVTLNTGRIMHFFRLDPGPQGSHTGNNGHIVKRHSDDGGQTWSLPDSIYGDIYDDRNINGGILSNGRIVLTFRRYNAVNQQHIDYDLMYSDDGGVTWSARQVITTNGCDSDTHNIIYVPTAGYMNEINTTYYLETRYSNDGVNWTQRKTWDYRTTHTFIINEACFAYTRNGKIIGLIRNDSVVVGGNYYQVSSYDYGQTWANLIHTNIANGYFCPSPLIFYDSVHDDLWAIATDRRGDIPGFTNMSDKIWIYRSNVDSIINNPKNWKLMDTILRPFPNYYKFYGYPTVTLKNDGNYLIVFTESYKSSNSERANFYQFEIRYNNSTGIMSFSRASNQNGLSQNYPNPVKNTTTIEYYISENYKKNKVVINFYNYLGRIMFSYSTCSFSTGKNSMTFDASELNDGVYYYSMDEALSNETKKMIVLK